MSARYKTALLALCAPLAAQAAQPQTENSQRIDAELRKLEYSDFCLRLGRSLRSNPEKIGNTRYELTLKIAAEPTHNVTAKMHAPIKKREPAIGMTVCAVLAAMGRADTVNRTVNSQGERHQLVYRNQNRYVYLDNFIVTGWQDQP